MFLRNCFLLLALCSLSISAKAHHYIDYSGTVPIRVTDFSITYKAAPITPTTFAYSRTINVRVKSQPVFEGAINPLQSPIVIYAHGGAEGNADGHADVGQEWTDALAQAGFITINIGHAAPTTADELIATCSLVNIDNNVNIDNSSTFGYQYAEDAPDANTALDPNENTLNHDSDCAYFQRTQILRNADIQAVLDRIPTAFVDEVPFLLHQWNDQIALMGHSAGTGAVMSYAGATRTYLAPWNTYEVSDQALFDAYIALSPQSETPIAPHFNGYAQNAWDDIQQPVLMISGRKDTTDSQAARDRKIPYDDMPAGDKYFLWFTGNTSGHSEMAMQKHYAAVQLKRQYDASIATVVRFLDKYTRNQPNLVLDYAYISTQNPGYVYNKLKFFGK